jgi:VIT1/CCC1 family predicted Fe2+/Mn2+ transporter
MNIEIPHEIIMPRENDTNEPIGHEHFSHRTQFLRAMVLALSDGVVSTAAILISLFDNVNNNIYILTGVASIVAGASSMFCSEYVSISSQRDAEKLDILKETLEQEKSPEARIQELEQLTDIYVKKGLDYELAKTVAIKLTEHDVIATHCLDEHGIDINSPDGCGSGIANPIQAGVVSFISFLIGGAVPFLASAFIIDIKTKIIVLITSSGISLLTFGGISAYVGVGNDIINITKGMLRMIILGSAALAINYGIGKAIGTSTL